MKSKQKYPLISSFLRALKRNFPQQWSFLQAGMTQGAENVVRSDWFQHWKLPLLLLLPEKQSVWKKWVANS